MRVTSKSGNVGASKPVSASKPLAPGPTPLAAGHEVNDALRVSGTAQFIAVARARIAHVPDVRTAKVEAIKARLESNGYHPDGEAVADGLVKEYTPSSQKETRP